MTPHGIETFVFEGFRNTERSGRSSERTALVQIAGSPYLRAGTIQQPPLTASALAAAFEAHGADVFGQLDGAFSVVLHDPATGGTHVITDRFNVIPTYVGIAGQQIAAGTHPDDLATQLGLRDLDLVTMAQALHMWYATFPYTYYEGIRELEPATVHTWDREGRYWARPYWEPQFRDTSGLRARDLAEQLAEAIRGGVQRRVRDAANPGLLLSAGADSRALLFSAIDVKPIRCYTFFDEPNAELQVAAKLAASVGQQHVPLQRDREYYGRIAADATRAMAGMWNFLDGHTMGFTERFEEDRIDLLLSGDFADLLFKGAGLNIDYQKLFGKNLTIKKTGRFSVNWRTPMGRVGDRFLAPIRARVEEQYRGIDLSNLGDEGWWSVAHARVGSLSRTGSIGGPTSLLRRLPWDTFMADRAMCEVYEQLTTDHRVNGTVWERAVKLLTPRVARTIPNNNWGASVGASDVEKTARFLYGVAYRKLRKRDIDGTPLNSAITRGSWPNFNYFLRHSEVVDDLWTHRNPQVTEILNDLTGTNLTDPEVSAAARTAGMGFGRLLTLKLWLEDRFSESVPHAPSAP